MKEEVQRPYGVNTVSTNPEGERSMQPTVNLMNTIHDTTLQAMTPSISQNGRRPWTRPFIFLALAASLYLARGGFAQSPAIVKTNMTISVPNAIVISVQGRCTFSEDGVAFRDLKAGHALVQGAVVRTGENSRTDIFFRRIGTSVRLQEGTDVKLETMSRQTVAGEPVMKTLLDLRTGRIFTVVRSLIPGSTMEIRNAAGRSMVEGAGGQGRYIITADGTHVADKDSVIPLKLIGETGITIITPGQKFDGKEGKVFPLAAPAAVDDLIAFDEMQSLAEELTPALAKTTQDPSEALVLSAGAGSTCDRAGKGFEALRVGQVLLQGAVIKSGGDSVVDLFLRRWGTTIRLMPGTELSLDQMTRSPGILVSALETHLDLRAGRIFCFIRIPVPESVFEVKTKAGRSVLKSAGAGRYDIRADGTIVAGKSSFKQVQVVTESGVVTVESGQKFTPEDGHMVPAAPSEVEMMMIQMDQLVALAEQLSFADSQATTVGSAPK